MYRIQSIPDINGMGPEAQELGNVTYLDICLNAFQLIESWTPWYNYVDLYTVM